MWKKFGPENYHETRGAKRISPTAPRPSTPLASTLASENTNSNTFQLTQFVTHTTRRLTQMMTSRSKQTTATRCLMTSHSTQTMATQRTMSSRVTQTKVTHKTMRSRRNCFWRSARSSWTDCATQKTLGHRPSCRDSRNRDPMTFVEDSSKMFEWYFINNFELRILYRWCKYVRILKI